MNTHEYLEQYREMRRRMGYHLRMADSYREEAARLPLARLQALKVSSSPSGDAPFVHPLEKAYDMEDLLAQDIRIMNRLRAQMEQAIAALQEEELRLVLRLRYMDCKPFSEIGELLLIDRSTAKRWQKRALEAFVLPDPPVDIHEEISSETCNMRNA